MHFTSNQLGDTQVSTVKSLSGIPRPRIQGAKDTTQPQGSSKFPRIPQTIIGPPRTPRELPLSPLTRFNRTLDQYGCATPRWQLPSRQKMAMLQKIDPLLRAQVLEMKMDRPLLTPRTQRIVEHRRDMEELKVQAAVGRMFPHPPGSTALDAHKFVSNVMSRERERGPRTPSPRGRWLKRDQSSVFTVKQRADSQSSDTTSGTSSPETKRIKTPPPPPPNERHAAVDESHGGDSH